MGDVRTARLKQADPFVREYVALIDEGWSPDLEEFINRVPEDLREEVFQKIDRALANRQAEAKAQFLQPNSEEGSERIIIPVPPPGEQAHGLAAQPSAAEPEPQTETEALVDQYETPADDIETLQQIEALQTAANLEVRAFEEDDGYEEHEEHQEVEEDVPQYEVEDYREPEPQAAEHYHAVVEDVAPPQAPAQSEVAPEPEAEPAGSTLELPEPVNHGPTPKRAPSDFVVSAVTRLLPGGIRERFRDELLAGRRDMRELGMPAFEIRLFTFQQLILGLAQHAPLQRSRADDGWANPRTFYGWVAWRVAGPLLLLAFLTGSFWFVGGAVICLAGAMTALLYAVHKDHLDHGTMRLINSVLGGCLVTVALSIFWAICAGLLVVVGGALGVNWMPIFGVKAMTFLAAATACAVTATGWTPDAWTPKRRDLAKKRARAG
jgi:hypothetical protein